MISAFIFWRFKSSLSWKFWEMCPTNPWDEQLHVSWETWYQKWDLHSPISRFEFREICRWSRQIAWFLVNGHPQSGTHNLEPTSTDTHNLEPTTLWLTHLFSIKTNGRKIPETELQQILKNQILWSALQVSLDLSLEVGSRTSNRFWVKLSKYKWKKK